ncbi:MAG: glycosyltransferase family 4 protein, partial [Acidimicrobiales bacterium]
HPEWHERTKVPVFSRAIRVAAQRADALICVSRYTAELLEQRTTPRGRLFVIPHGVDHDRFRPEEPDQGADEQVLHRLGVRLPFVLFLGTLEPRKSVPDLVRAFERVATVRPDVSLVLAGRPGWRAHEIERTLADTPATGRIVRTGYVPDAEVPALLRRAAAVAYPAREEGFGLPALEALACGAPLVTTRGTAMAELAGDAALLVDAGAIGDLADALAETLSGSAAVHERRRRGLAVAARYTWETSAASHLEAYEWAADAHGSSPAGGRAGGR